ncbi:MAG: hypothetical protein CMF29_04150 [Kiritimatiellaceae bacterium]|nr:hypothetical protein [Kiritimatiellaceae bacterium]|tara:strand:- start:3967 stop:4527 length:561 start_codon:yes stop_codon:yes gene_type:complete
MKNLNDDHIEMIDRWLGQYNTNYPENRINDEDRVFKFFDNILQSEIQFKDRANKPSIKEGVKTVYSLLDCMSHLAPYYKRKYEHLLTPLAESLTFDIQEFESRQESKTSIGQGQVLETTLLINEWQKLTHTEPSPSKEGAFDSFVRLLYQLRDPEYHQDHHELLISRAIEMKQRMESNLGQAADRS